MGGNYHFIDRNIIINSLGNSFGTSNYNNKPENTAAQGIYPDDRSGNITIQKNLVINANWGLQIHNSQYNIVKKNIFFKSRRSAFTITEDSIVNITGFCRGNFVEDNIFHSVSLNQPVVFIGGRLGFIDLVFLENNRYYGYSSLLFNVINVKSSDEYISLIDWRESKGMDYNSRIIGEYDDHPDYVVNSFVFNSTSQNFIKNGKFNGTINNWGKGWSDPHGHVHTIFSEKFGGSLESYVNRTDSKTYSDVLTTSSRFEIGKDVTYVLSLNVFSSETDTIGYVVRKCEPDWQSVGLSERELVNSTIKNQIFVFNGSRFYNKSCLYLHSGLTPFSTYNIDNVTLTTANVLYHDKGDDFLVVYNALMRDTTIYFDKFENYCDIEGKVVGKSLKLPPFGSFFLIKCFCNKDFVCNNYENANTCPEDCDPVCGNNICEIFSENWRNCPSDCLNVGLLVFSIIFVVFDLIILLICVIIICIMSFSFKILNNRSKLK